MASQSKRLKKILMIVAALVILSPVAGRLYSRRAALEYGRYHASAFGALGTSGFSDTKELRAFLNERDLVRCENTTKHLSFLGGRYYERIQEFKSGLTYLSEQMSLPAERRFTDPPTSAEFPINTRNVSDHGVGESISTLIISYLEST